MDYIVAGGDRRPDLGPPDREDDHDHSDNRGERHGVEEVLRELAGTQPVRALVRDASRAPAIDSVEYVVGDLDRPPR
ncbi:hypothetical protein NKG94_04855 [Micromonospora sp. M12]